MIRDPRNDVAQAGAEHRTRTAVTRAFGAALAALLIGAGAHRAQAGDVKVKVEGDDGTYKVNGTFEAKVSGEVAWGVLTDYDHIGEYVKSVRNSTVEQREVRHLLLRQDARGGFF